jgi:UDP-N-acetylmuramoyl-tripeptide--D-alanyl-D-alanine ligase
MPSIFRRETLWRAAALFAPIFYWIAFAWRRMLPRTTVIAITGSLGKTTTKELLADILASVAPTYRTNRNQNSPSLVTLNVLRMRRRHRYAVIELAGASPGSLRSPARLVRPDVVIILNVLRTHRTSFANSEEYAKEKAVLLEWLKPGGVAVLNQDDPFVSQMAIPKGARVYRFGTSSTLEHHADNVSAAWPNRLSFTFHVGDESRQIETQLVGAHWIPSAAAALTAATALGVDLDVAVAAVNRTKPFPARMRPARLPSGAVILRDDYNASIDAIDMSLRVLEEATALRRMLVITDMSDFGKNRKQRLKYLGARSAEVADSAVFIGDLADYGKRRAIEAGLAPDAVHAFGTLREAADFLRGDLKSGDLVLLKGRTTDHATRIFFAQLGEVKCWKEYCGKRMLCDLCPRLGLPRETLRAAANE